MRNVFLNTFLVLAFAQSCAWAGTVWTVDPAASSLTFYGKSTLHNFEGSAGKIRGRLFFPAGLSAGRGDIETDVFSFKTGIKKRDRNMYAMFDAKKFPVVRLDVQKADFSKAADHKASFDGTLTIHGVSRPFHTTAGVTTEKDGYVCRGSFPLKLRDFGLRPPSVFGIIRVANQVKVRFKVAFHHSP